MATIVCAQTAGGEQQATHDTSRPSTDLAEQGIRLRPSYGQVLADHQCGGLLERHENR
ncbi:MAG: hypothetical protein OXG30_09755 [bacterium]|nr:hypothetical protein [bacterium]